jgi:hypothetical protein
MLVTSKFRTAARCPRVAALLLALAVTGLAQSQEYYRVDFESARHVVGSPPATGGTDAPTVVGTGGPAPTIVAVAGNKKLQFDATGLADFTYVTAEFLLGRGVKFYRIEFDLTFISMPEWRGGNPSFRILLDTPSVENLEFLRSGGVIGARVYVAPSGSTLGSHTATAPLPSQSALHCIIDVDLRLGRWTITANGQRIHQGPFYSDIGDIKNMRISGANVGTGPSVTHLDNLVVSAVVPPTLPGTVVASASNVFVGEPVSFALTAPPTGTSPLRYQWRLNSIDIAGATGPTLSLPSATVAQTGDYTLLVSNDAGSVESAAARLIVRVRPPTLASDAQPLGQTVVVGSPVTIALRGTPGGTGPFRYSWRRNGVAVPGQSSSALNLASVTFEDAGSYTVVVTNDGGSIESAAAVLVVQAQPPSIAADAQPQPVTTFVGRPAILGLTGAVQGTGPFAYQWKRDGIAIPGATRSSLTVAVASPADRGSYSLLITGPGGSIETRAAALTVRDRTRAVNMSVRAISGVGENSLIVGFVVAGANQRDLLLRAAGPALTRFGVDNVLTDPRLTVAADDGTVLARNDDWSDAGSQASSALFTSVGAFSFSAGSKDSALRVAVTPARYTAQITGAAAVEGATIGELYDLSTSDGGLGRLVNVSARGPVDAAGRTLIIGLVVDGPDTQRFLFRAVGPSLVPFGVGNAAGNPLLSLRRGDGTELAANDDLGAAPEFAAVFAQVGAFALPPGSRDAALVVELAAGNYTVVIGSVSGSRPGVVLAEAYELP